jgi:Fe-S-cluster containining protein
MTTRAPLSADAHAAAAAAAPAAAPLPSPLLAAARAVQCAPAPAAGAGALHPCLDCGACCAAFRVDFSIHELDAHGGAVPAGLAVALNATLARLRGTDHVPPRCAALAGRIGERVQCGIYAERPGACRELEPGSEACDGARARHGMPSL